MITELLSGLKLGELILMILGVILFIVLLILVIIKSLKNQDIKLLLLAFIGPLLFIGYPTIQSIKIKDYIEITKEATKAVETDPTDSTAYNVLVNMIDKLDFDRVKNDPDRLITVGKAQSALGNYQEAIKTTDQALTLAPDNAEAKMLRSEAETSLKVTEDFSGKIKQLDQIISDPSTEASKANGVVEILSNVKPPVYIDKRSSLVLAKAFAIVHEREKALEALKSVPQIGEEDSEAQKLKTELQQDTSTTKLSPTQERKLNSSVIMRANMKKVMVAKPRQ